MTVLSTALIFPQSAIVLFFVLGLCGHTLSTAPVLSCVPFASCVHMPEAQDRSKVIKTAKALHFLLSQCGCHQNENATND